MKHTESTKELIRGWTEHLQASGAARGTIALRVSHVRRALDGIARPLPEITTADLEAWLAGHDWAPEARRSARSSLRAFWTWAVREAHASRDVACELPAVRRPRRTPRAVPDAVIIDALARCDARVALAIEIMATCGLRRVECARVRSSDVEPVGQGWILHVVGKGGHARAVPCPTGLARRIQAAGGWLFPGSDHGHVSPAWLGRLIGRTLPAGVTPHQLRHRYATVAYRSSHDIRAVQRLLGHASIATTEVYVALDDEGARAAARAAWRIMA